MRLSVDAMRRMSSQDWAKSVVSEGTDVSKAEPVTPATFSLARVPPCHTSVHPYPALKTPRSSTCPPQDTPIHAPYTRVRA